MSRWFVGSSSRKIEGRRNSSFASSIRMRQPPENSLVGRPKSSAGAQQRLFDIRIAGLAAEDMVVILRIVQAVQQLRITVAFVADAPRSRASGARSRGAAPPRTPWRSPRRASSYRPHAWSAAEWPIVIFRVTLPEVGRCSPVMMRSSVVLPAPFRPTMRLWGLSGTIIA